ncbi:hypothetical protein LA20533_03090 [Amylolactobacillus amylophilus DSM 20533 = JCM 1125]|uniref:Uncharacterized protein n=3 Tax=Amylolactobacillus TaxID=2767876 RepID=A0A1L6XBG8_9LACO|nr:hypothetical protein LA20533_03090 [Amylolactobacillus amylophilus DSM 20533 = JCM 1125]
MNLNDAPWSVFITALLLIFYFGYNCFFVLFKLFGYHPKPTAIKLGGSRLRMSVPVFTPMTPEFKQLIASRLTLVRFYQGLFTITKFCFLIIFAYLCGKYAFYNTEIWQLIVGLSSLFIIFLMNTIITWIFVHAFRLNVIAKEFNRPIFNLEERQ